MSGFGELATTKSRSDSGNRRRFLRVETAIPMRFRALRPDEFEEGKGPIRLTPQYVPFGAYNRVPGERELLRELESRTAGLDPTLLRFLVQVNEKLDRLLGVVVGTGYDPELLRVGVIRNMSGSGLLLATREPLHVGQVLDLEFSIPGTVQCALTAAGVVRRSDPDIFGAPPVETRGEHFVGLEFIGLEEDDQDRIIRYTLRRERELRRAEYN